MTTLVLGAGIAGIAAARALADADQPVTVLEARDRIGGRVYTRRDLVSGVPVEMGAEYLHGEGVPQWEIVNKLGLKTLHWTKLDDSLVRLEDDRLLTMRQARETVPTFDITRSWDLPDVPPHPEDEDLHRYLSKIQFTNDQLQYTRRSFANATGESIHHISATAALEDMRDDSVGTQDWRVLNGYDTVVHFLALGIDVRLNTVVAAVKWHDGGVTVTTADGKTFEAERAIIALPVGVLTSGSIQFDPPLPGDKTNALRALAMGPGMKMVYVFDEPILPEGITALYSKHNPPMWWSPTFGQPHAKQHAITAFATGDWARELYQLGEQGMINKGLATLRAELGTTLPDPAHVTVQDWTNDPFAGGVYSVVSVGGASCRNVLAQPSGRSLYWAGEATAPNPWAATVHGALHSGRRAANDVLGALDITV